MASKHKKPDKTKAQTAIRPGPPPEIVEFSPEWWSWPEWLSKKNINLTLDLLKRTKAHAAGLSTEEVSRARS